MGTERKLKGPGERRREAIMNAALDLFISKGYAAVSVDEIIRRSGGSKSSVYEYFGTKEGLLREIIVAMANDALKATEMPVREGQSPREVLTRIGVMMCGEILNEKGIGLFRLAVSNSGRFPELSRMFFESGPRTTWSGMAEYLKKEHEAGRLNVKNPMRAAEFFVGMLLVKDHIAMPVGYPAPSKAQIKARVKDAVDVFMAAYGKEGL